MTAEQALDMAHQHIVAGQAADAERLCRQVLGHDPNDPEALHILGVIAASVGKNSIAAELIARAAQGNPANAIFRSNLGQVLTTLGRFDEAAQQLQTALRLDPDRPEAHNNFGHLLMQQGRFALAVDHLRRAIALQPEYVQAHSNLAASLEKTGALDEAIETYRTIIRLKPGYAEAYNNLGNALCNRADLDEAIECLRRAVTLRPDLVAAHSNLVYTLLFHRDYDPQRIDEEHRAWSRQHADPLKPSIKPHDNDPEPDRRLRIGHVSPEFRVHCLSQFTIPLLSNHDHTQFEVHCYADLSQPDAITERIRQYADGWHNIAGMSDEQAAELIRAHQIDILIDHTMHMNNGRPLLLARKPAPIQATWVAYPGTTGMTAVDYRMTDPQLDPPGMGDRFYSEQSIRLPHTFWCYDPLTTEPLINALPAESNRFITFGSLNNFCKMNDATLALWSRILHKIAGSRLILRAPLGRCRQWVLRMLDIAHDRVEFISYLPRAEYLKVYHRMDIALDTMPYNGHTTSFDALWMGVPVVTLAGQTCVSRGGKSLLTNLGLTELVATTDDQYVEIAQVLANDLSRLAELRRTLRSRMETSPLMDGPRFARDFEAALRGMWRTWCKTRNLQSIPQ